MCGFKCEAVLGGVGSGTAEVKHRITLYSLSRSSTPVKHRTRGPRGISYASFMRYACWCRASNTYSVYIPASSIKVRCLPAQMLHRSPSLRHDFFPYQLYDLLFSWTPAERGAHISRRPALQNERDKREARAPLLLGESSGYFLRCCPRTCVHSWHNRDRVRASLKRRHVLGRHGCTMQPPCSHRHKCKMIYVNSLGIANL
jgi:hypothetical protein